MNDFEQQLTEHLERRAAAASPRFDLEAIERGERPTSDGDRLPGGPSPAHWPRRLVAVAAAVALMVAASVAVLQDDDRAGRVTSGPDPTSVVGFPRGSIAFAADAGAGAALTDPVEYQRVETVPEDMDIYVARAGEPIRRVISSDAHERCPTFSPDGGRLAYVSTPGTSPGASYPERGPAIDASIVVLRLDGAMDPSDPALVVPFPAAPGYGVRRNLGYACPQWSPDGSRLAYLTQAVAADPTSNVAELRIVTLDGQQRVVTTEAPAGDASPFAWSPTGDKIAYVSDGAVWTAAADGGSPSLVWQPDRAPTALSWSSSGELAVSVSGEAPYAAEVHIVDVDAGTATFVDTLRYPDRSASWSPDGSRVAFVREDGQIVLSDRDDGSTVLLSLPVVDVRPVGLVDVAWSADGEELLALAHNDDIYSGSSDPFKSLGMALLSLSTDGAVVDVLTPWTWAFDWIALEDVSAYPNTNEGQAP